MDLGLGALLGKIALQLPLRFALGCCRWRRWIGNLYCNVPLHAQILIVERLVLSARPSNSKIRSECFVPLF